MTLLTLLYVVTGFIFGYCCAMRDSIRHLRAANDLIRDQNAQLRALLPPPRQSTDDADWWKRGEA